MKATLVALGAVLIAGPVLAQASAQLVKAGSRGGFYCLDEEEIAKTTAGKFKARPDGIGPSCRPISPFEEVRAASVYSMDGGVTGTARFQYVSSARYVIYLDKMGR